MSLETDFSCLEYVDVEADDDIFVQQCAIGEYSVFLWKDYGSSITEPIQAYWKGKSNFAPSQSTVYLQIANHRTFLWETVDSDSTTAADTEFTLEHTQYDDLDDYYGPGGNLWAFFRVYQRAYIG
jgi:hypothetical protein